MPGGLHATMRRWEPAEDYIILDMLGTIGPRWSKIAAALPDRTIPSIRNRWQRIDKGRREVKQGGTFKRCPHCSQPRKGHVCFEQLIHQLDVIVDMACV